MVKLICKLWDKAEVFVYTVFHYIEEKFRGK